MHSINLHSMAARSICARAGMQHHSKDMSSFGQVLAAYQQPQLVPHTMLQQGVCTSHNVTAVHAQQQHSCQQRSCACRDRQDAASQQGGFKLWSSLCFISPRNLHLTPCCNKEFAPHTMLRLCTHSSNTPASRGLVHAGIGRTQSHSIAAQSSGAVVKSLLHFNNLNLLLL